MEQLIHDNGLLGSEESRQKARCMMPRETDVFIVTYPKSGTTWVQQILFQMVSGGSMDFGEICEVVPWIEHAHYLGQDVEALPSPRLFKSHFEYESIPKGNCKYIYVLRDGRDVAVSFYHFLSGMMPEEHTFREFFLDFFMAGKSQSGSWFSHVKGWWKHRHDRNVLILAYEDMEEDLARTVATIADFCGFELGPELFETVVEHSSFRFMKQHEHHFDDHFVRDAIHIRTGVGRWATKVRQGQSGSYRSLMTPDLEALFEAELAAQMAEIAVRRYSDLRAALRRARGE